MPKLRAQHPRMNFIWLADSIYATAPFIKTITDKKEDFIIRIKKGDHKYLYKHLDENPHNSYKTTTGKSTIAYHWYENVPLNKSTNITVTVIKAFVITTDRNGNKKSRWCLLKRKENLTEKQASKLKDLLTYNLKSIKAYLLKEELNLFWEYTSPFWAGKFLDLWCTKVMRSKIEPMKKIAKSLRKHKPLILNWFRAKKHSLAVLWRA